MNNEFEILHFSYRVRETYTDELESPMEAKVNLVFKVIDKSGYLNRRCERESSEISEVITLSSIEDYNNYVSNLEQVTDIGSWCNEQKQYEKVFIKSYTINDMPLLTYIPKFDVYRFSEWVDWSPATQGIIEEIKLISQGENKSSSSIGCHFLRCLRALDIFWS